MKNLLSVASKDVFCDWSGRLQRIFRLRRRVVDKNTYTRVKLNVDPEKDVIVREEVQWNGCGLRVAKIFISDKKTSLNYFAMQALEQSSDLSYREHGRFGYYRWLSVWHHCKQHKQNFSVLMNTRCGDGRTILEALIASEDHASLRLVHELLPRGVQQGNIYLSHSLAGEADPKSCHVPVVKYGVLST